MFHDGHTLAKRYEHVGKNLGVPIQGKVYSYTLTDEQMEKVLRDTRVEMVEQDNGAGER